MDETAGSAKRLRIPLRIVLSFVILAALLPPLVLLAMVVVAPPSPTALPRRPPSSTMPRSSPRWSTAPCSRTHKS